MLKFIDAISEKTLRSTVSLTASRGRGKSAALGLAVAGAVAFGYSNIFVTSPSPENLNTFFQFVFKGECLELVFIPKLLEICFNARTDLFGVQDLTRWVTKSIWTMELFSPPIRSTIRHWSGLMCSKIIGKLFRYFSVSVNCCTFFLLENKLENYHFCST